MHKSPQRMHISPLEPRWLHSAGNYRSDLGVGKPLHTHPVWEAVYYLQGRPQCRAGHEVFGTSPGLLMAIPPGVPHGEVTDLPWDCYWVLFEHPGLPCHPILIHDDAEASIRHLVRLLIREWRSEQEHRAVMTSHLVGQLGVTLMRASALSTPTPAERMVQQFERALEDRFAESLTISDLCEEFGVSASYMRAQFKRYRCASPMERLQQLRVRQAVSSIQNSSQTLDAIADLCGFSSASHLSRQVKRLTGLAPGAFRASIDQVDAEAPAVPVSR